MASEEEDLLDDGNFKDLGELEDLDDEEENALLGDSDEEGSNRVRDRTISFMSTSTNRQMYSGDEDEGDVEEGQEQEYEYVDVDGNPVDIDANDFVEYVEVSQDDANQTGLEESTNEFVLDLVVDPDLEFDESGVQDARNESTSSATMKPMARASLPSTVHKQQHKADKHRQPQQSKAAQAKLESQKQKNNRLQQQQKKHDEQQRRHGQQQQQQQQQRKQQEQRNQEQQRIQQPRALRQQKQQQFMNIRNSSIENEKSMENAEQGFKQEENYDSAADNEGEQQYNTSLKNDSSESEDEEESGRGRFRTERSNVISVSTAKKRPNIPDSLEAVISHEEAARLERSNRMQSKRPWHRGESARDSPRDRERERNRERERDKARNRDYDRNYKEGSQMPRHQEISPINLAHFQQHSDSAPSFQDSDSSTNSEQKASRKILINPHFKGSIVPSSDVLPKPGYSWDNQSNVINHPSDHSSTGSSEYQFMPHQATSEGHFGASFGAQPSNNLLNPLNVPQNPIRQYQFTQPPPVKHNASFSAPPPTMPDFQSRPPPLMSIPPLIPPIGNHLGGNVNLFPPPREQPTPRLAFDTKTHELPQLQFQTGNDSWAHTVNQHNFKPYNVPPPNQSFPPIRQNTEQMPPSFPNVQQPPPPIQRTEFQHQLPPPSGPPPSFNRPPPGFDINVRLGAPPPSRPMLTSWPTQQQPQRPQPPMLLSVFNRPPPPANIASRPNNFQATNLSLATPPLIRPSHSSMNEPGLGHIGQFSQLGIQQLQQPFTPTGQNTNLRSLPQQQQQHLHQQNWSSSNLRPIAQQKQPFFGKRPSNEVISASPLKQIRITNKPLAINRRLPQVNTNIRQVEIVDKLPPPDILPQSFNRGKNSSRQVTNQAQIQQVASNALKNSEEISSGSTEEDEETQRYREQIELQKKKREEVLRRKEQRRLMMAHERRKQMLQQQQQPGQEVEPAPESNMPLPVGIASANPLLSPSEVKEMASDQSCQAVAQSNAQSENAKKRVVYFRKVVSRPFGNMRRPAGVVGSPIRTVTNAGSIMGPGPFLPDMQLEQKGMMQRLPQQLPSQAANANAIARIPVTTFSNNSNLTNITLQRPSKTQPQNLTGVSLMRNPKPLGQAPRQVNQQLQQPGRPNQQLARQPQQPRKLLQLPCQINQQPGRPAPQQEKPVQQAAKQFQQTGRPQQPLRGQPQHPRVPQQQPGGQLRLSGGPLPKPPGRQREFQAPNAVNKPVARITLTPQSDVNRPRQMMTTEVGVVNVSPDVKLRAANSGLPNRVVINSTKRAIPAGSAQPVAKKTTAEMPANTGPAQQTQQQQVSPVNTTSQVQIENLAQATSDVQLRKLCQSIGPVESVNLFKDQRRALVKFKNGHHAKEFMDRYQRRMVDLSLIAISLVS